MAKTPRAPLRLGSVRGYWLMLMGMSTYVMERIVEEFFKVGD